MKQIHVRLSDALRSAVEAEAKRTKCSTTAFIERLVIEYFKQKEPTEVKPDEIGLELVVIRDRLDEIIYSIETNPISLIGFSDDDQSDEPNVGTLPTDSRFTPALDGTMTNWDNYPEMREPVEDTEIES